MNNNVVPKRTKTITLRYILGWIFGIVFVLLGFVASFDSNLFAGIFAFAIAVVILPPVSKVIEEKYDLVFSGGVKSVLVVVMLFGFGYFFKTSPAIPSPVENTSQVVQEKITTVRKFFSRLKNNWKEFKKNIIYEQNKETKEWIAYVEYNGENFQGKGKRKVEALSEVCIKFENLFYIDMHTNRICRWPLNMS
jgi:predicted PurR-regulated permease PerM